MNCGTTTSQRSLIQPQSEGEAHMAKVQAEQLFDVLSTEARNELGRGNPEPVTTGRGRSRHDALTSQPVDATWVTQGPDLSPIGASRVRHPNFHRALEVPEGDGRCRACGGPAHSGLLCDSCRDEGWTDAYGVIEEPDGDDRDDDDEDGWPEDFDSGYGPNSYYAHAMSKDD